jgi:hypothetical protein
MAETGTFVASAFFFHRLRSIPFNTMDKKSQHLLFYFLHSKTGRPSIGSSNDSILSTYVRNMEVKNFFPKAFNTRRFGTRGMGRRCAPM